MTYVVASSAISHGSTLTRVDRCSVREFSISSFSFYCTQLRVCNKHDIDHGQKLCPSTPANPFKTTHHLLPVSKGESPKRGGGLDTQSVPNTKHPVTQAIPNITSESRSRYLQYSKITEITKQYKYHK